ncbi:vesicle-associated protein 1-2-like [Dorcoceras hygrometricum]|uniref:Vesicle-associated protein 1-2-like n=1 Tax=Dorcoceras hygrometricum TaxID=472368 RepID=A0A2Z7CWE8_9LAMI|nr:vesicle-associated protein 1-2-like [Dorcoceras hygrometricum]
MSYGDLLLIDPLELQFPLTMQAQKEAPPDMQCRDKFLLQSVVVRPGITAKDITPEMFTKESGNHVDECKLKVTYVPPPQPPSPVREGSEEDSSPRASVSDNGTMNQTPEFNFVSKALSESHESTPEVKAMISKLTEEKQNAIQQNKKLQQEMELLKRQGNRGHGGIPFKYVIVIGLIVELKKQISCSMQLTNKSDDYVAFKVKTTNPKKYCVRPNTGVVVPHSACDVIVTMQAQKEAPPDMQCRDKFLLQSVVVRPGITAKDITPQMFTKESGNHVDECKLKVTYVPPPQPPSPVREGSEEDSSPRASVSDNGTVNQTPEFNFMSKALNESHESTPEVKAMISKLTEEKQNAIQQNKKLQQEMVIFWSRDFWEMGRIKNGKQLGSWFSQVIADSSVVG